MYVLEDRKHYVKQALMDNLLKKKAKKIFQNGLPPIYIDENFDILNFTKNSNSCAIFKVYGDKKLEEYVTRVRKHYTFQILSNKKDFSILSGYSKENDYFTKYQECLNIHTKSLALLNIIRRIK